MQAFRHYIFSVKRIICITLWTAGLIACNSTFVYSQKGTDPVRDETAISIQKATEYFTSRGDNIYPLTLPLLIPVVRYYHSDSGLENILQRSADSTLYPFARLYDEGWKKQFDGNRLEGISPADETVLRCLYCDTLPLQDSLLFRLNRLYENGGYDLTHAYLAILFLKRNTCDHYFTGDMISLEEKLVTALQQIILSEPVTSDLRIESMAFLLYGGKREYISEKRIRKLIRKQQKNGSWTDPHKPDPLLVDHTTALALWTLLEWKNAADPVLYLPPY